MFTVRIDDKRLKSTLRKIAKRGRNMRPLMVAYYATVYKEVMLNFRKQGSYGDILSGKPSKTFMAWKALSSLTLAGRLAAGTGTAKLQASNRMRMSVGTVRRVTSTEMEIGTDIIQGATMHFGAEGADAIRPVKSKYLTIPMPGVTGKARDYENTFFAKSMMFQKQSDGSITPLFILKEKVEIPARPFMTIGIPILEKMDEMAAAYLLGAK